MGWKTTACTLEFINEDDSAPQVSSLKDGELGALHELPVLDEIVARVLFNESNNFLLNFVLMIEQSNRFLMYLQASDSCDSKSCTFYQRFSLHGCHSFHAGHYGFELFELGPVLKRSQYGFSSSPQSIVGGSLRAKSGLAFQIVLRTK